MSGEEADIKKSSAPGTEGDNSSLVPGDETENLLDSSGFMTDEEMADRERWIPANPTCTGVLLNIFAGVEAGILNILEVRHRCCITCLALSRLPLAGRHTVRSDLLARTSEALHH